MRQNFAIAGLAACAILALSAPLSAQDEPPPPASATFLGDTGLWFVPTARILEDGKWSASGHIANFDREQGFTAINSYAGTFAYGLRDRVEIFGSVRFLTRLDRDLRPLFDAGQPRFGGLVNGYPLVTEPFSGNNFGEIVVGGKVSVMSEGRMSPASLAVRGFVTLPSGSKDAGTTSGQVNGEVDLVLSKLIGNAEVAGFGGFAFRGDPENIDVANGFTWGAGIGAPVRGPFQIFGEVRGEAYLSDEITLSEPLVGSDGSISGLSSPLRSPVDVTVGVQWNGPIGIYAAGGLNWATRHGSRPNIGQEGDAKDKLGLLFRLGYRPVQQYLPPAEPPPPVPANRPPTVTATCDPCELGFGEESQLRADAQDPDGDPLNYRWTTPAGELVGSPNRATQQWRAPDLAGPVPVTVTVSDGRGGSASDTVTLQVVAPPAPPVREFVFEDVHFDFDRYTLRSGAARVLDEVIAAMEDNPDLNIQIEGHTCNIGTNEYNLALGERRATSVREYLTGQGVGSSRLQTVSYGEERPAHDNAREETRRLNRRAALVVRLQ